MQLGSRRPIVYGLNLGSSLPARLGTSTGTQYYVDYANGSDSNDGSAPDSGHAWKTLDKAKNTVSLNGSIINMRSNGTAHQPLSGARTLIQRSATDPTNNPITIRTYPADYAINGRALFTGELCFGNSSSGQWRGWRVEKLGVTRLGAYQDTSSIGAYGIRIAGMRDVEVFDCDIYGNNQGSILISAADDVGPPAIDNIQIISNLLHDTGSASGAGNHNANGSHDHGIYLAGVDTNVVQNVWAYNNLIYRCFWGFTFQVFAPTTAATCLFAFNTCYDVTPGNLALTGGGNVALVGNDGTSGDGVHGVIVTSNILALSRQDANLRNAVASFGSFGDGNFVRNNLPWQINGPNFDSWVGWDNNATRDADNLAEQDPLFTDPSSQDFHIGAGSPAIGAGEAAYCPAFDFYGNPRSLADIGAVKF